MFRRVNPVIVVSEPDIQAALYRLRALPLRKNAPLSWDRQYVIEMIRKAVPSSVKIGDCIDIGPGLYGIIQPFGVDLAGVPPAESRLQVWIVVRSAGTDHANVTAL